MFKKPNQYAPGRNPSNGTLNTFSLYFSPVTVSLLQNKCGLSSCLLRSVMRVKRRGHKLRLCIDFYWEKYEKKLWVKKNIVFCFISPLHFHIFPCILQINEEWVQYRRDSLSRVEGATAVVIQRRWWGRRREARRENRATVEECRRRRTDGEITEVMVGRGVGRRCSMSSIVDWVGGGCDAISLSSPTAAITPPPPSPLPLALSPSLSPCA